MSSDPGDSSTTSRGHGDEVDGDDFNRDNVDRDNFTGWPSVDDDGDGADGEGADGEGADGEASSSEFRSSWEPPPADEAVNGGLDEPAGFAEPVSAEPTRSQELSPTEGWGHSANPVAPDPVSESVAEEISQRDRADAENDVVEDAGGGERPEVDPEPADGQRRGRGELSTLAMEPVAPPPARDPRPTDTEPSVASRSPARNWDRPVSELSFAELIDGALAAYREA